MKTRILWAVAALVLLTGCQEFGGVGKAVCFSAVTVAEPQTKTVYAGSGSVSGGKEQINWVAGDQIALYCSNDAVAATETGNDNVAIYTVAPETGDLKVAIPSSADGFVWKQESTNAIFYGVYPATTTSSMLGKFTMVLPQDQSANLGESTMSHGYLVAKNEFNSNSGNVTLLFEPVYTAFEIHLKSKDADLILTRFAIKSSTANLTGTYETDYTGSTPAFSNSSTAKEAFITFPANTTLTTSETVFNLYLLPTANLSELYLEVKFKKTASGPELTRILNLKVSQAGSYGGHSLNDGDWLIFDKGKKHNINALAVDSADYWLLSLSGDVQPWDGTERSIAQSVSISGKVNIQHAIETTDSWKAAHGNSSNHYFDTYWVEQGATGYGVTDSSHPNNYSKNYQIRTLNRDLPPSDRYFTITFTPTAPVGGYWQLIPQYKEGDSQSPRHFRFERSLPGGGKSADLYGQILNQQETIRIYPVDWDPSDINTYNVWFTCLFSTSPSFTNSINADSEFQDVHSDGRFSYWVFRLEQYQGQYE